MTREDRADTLVEVGFELRWPIPLDARRRVHASAYVPLCERMFEALAPTHPEVLALPNARRPLEETLFRPRHELRAKDPEAPRIRLGVGQLAVGRGPRGSFRQLAETIELAATALHACTPDPLHPDRAVLRYVNAIGLEGETSVTRFLRARLNTSLAVDPALFADPLDADRPSDLRFAVRYPLGAVAGHGRLAFSTGVHAGRPALLMELEAETVGSATPGHADALASWLDGARGVLVSWFETLRRGKHLAGVAADDEQR